MNSGDSENCIKGLSDLPAEHAPTVSICMITYNQEAYIAKAIDGAVEQDVPFNYELVIGEDHSTDRTREICIEYERKHRGVVRVLESEANLGITQNFARTLSACRGKYIALCEGDDFWTDRSKLNKQVKFLEEHPEYAMVSGRVEIVNEEGLTPSDTSQLQEQLLRLKSEPGFFDLLEYNMINTPTVCIRREVIVRLADEATVLRRGYCIDYWYWLRIASMNRIFIADDVYASYRVHPEGASRHSTFLRKRMPGIRHDAISHYLSEHNDVTDSEKAVLFSSMAGIVNGHGICHGQRIRSLLWCVGNLTLLRAWLRYRQRRIS